MGILFWIRSKANSIYFLLLLNSNLLTLLVQFSFFISALIICILLHIHHFPLPPTKSVCMY